jgi:hypothetical protein
VEEMKNAFKIFVGKPAWNRLRGLPKRRWKVYIRMNLRETGWGKCGQDSSS